MFLALIAGSVIINEIAWMGTDISANDEWIELYNTAGQEINLSGWKLKAEDGSPEISLEGFIASEGFYLLERTDDNAAPEAAAGLIYSGAMNNSGENLNLYDSSNNLADQIICSDGWPAGDNKTKETMQKINSEWKTAQATPGRKNKELEIEESVPPPEASYPDGVMINKIMPSPEGADSVNEYIEIKNTNNFEVDLSGWILRDKRGGGKEYVLEEKIAALSSLTLFRPKTKITLNNDGDGLELFNPKKEIADAVDFGKAQTGIAFVRTAQGWQWDVPKSDKTEISASPGIAPEQTPQKVESGDRVEFDLSPSSHASAYLTGLLTALFFSAIFLLLKKKLYGEQNAVV